MNPLNEPELLRLVVSPDNLKRAHFAYIMFINTMKDDVGRHFVFKSESPPVAWSALEEHFSAEDFGIHV